MSEFANETTSGAVRTTASRRGAWGVWLLKAGASGLAFVSFGWISLSAISRSETIQKQIALTMNESTGVPTKRPIVTTVKTLTIRHAIDPKISRNFSGVFIATQSSDLGFKHTGRLMDFLVDQGDSVDAGDVLAALDTESLIADAAVLKAKKRAAEARLAELVAGPRQQTISAAKAKLQEYASLRDQAKSTAERGQRLINENAVSRQEVDDAKFNLSASLNRFQAQQQVVEELEAGTRPEIIDAQNAIIEELDAQLESMEVRIRESILVAPYDAIVSKRIVDAGVVVAPGSIILRLIERKSPEAWIGLPPSVAASLKLNVDYQLLVNEKLITGRLKSVLPELDPATRTQTAVFETADDLPLDQRPTIGQVTRLQWERPSQHDGFWIPTAALTRGVRGLWSVFVVETDVDDTGEASDSFVINRRDVELLQVETDRVLVRGTIESGDRIVAAGGHRLAPGQRVQPQNDTGQLAANSESTIGDQK